MVANPVAGFPSKKAAIIAFIGEGLDDAEIVRRTGSTEMSVGYYRRVLARPLPMNREQIDTATRILAKAIPLIADHIGCSPGALQAAMRHIHIVFTDHPKPDAPSPQHQETPDPVPSTEPAEDAAGGEPSKASPAASTIALDDLRVAPAVERPPAPRPEPARLPPSTIYRLKHPTLEKWLHESCTTLTSDRRWAWKGISARANIVMSKIEAAKDLILDPII